MSDGSNRDLTAIHSLTSVSIKRLLLGRQVSAHLPRRTGIAAILAKGPHHKLIWSMKSEVSALDLTMAAGIVARVMSISLSRI